MAQLRSKSVIRP